MFSVLPIQDELFGSRALVGNLRATMRSVAFAENRRVAARGHSDANSKPWDEVTTLVS
jgi:hypothetical protein